MTCAFTVIVNGQPAVFAGVQAISFESLARLVFGDAWHDLPPTVTYVDSDGSGSLAMGDELFAQQGTAFAVRVPS